MSDPFIGEIRMVGFNYAPKGWDLCNGQLLNISSYTALFSLLGTTYGGDGRTTFGLPSLEGRSPMHAGYGPGLTHRSLGQLGGGETVTLTQQQIATHNHAWMGTSAEADKTEFAGHAFATIPARGAVPIYNDPSPATNITLMRPETLAASGSGASHDNMQPTLVVNFIIAIEGTYPVRP